MCKKTKGCGRKIDPCMRHFVKNANKLLNKRVEIRMCCCGHGKYPMTIILLDKLSGAYFEMFSGKLFLKSRKFYKRDKQGYYYIPGIKKEK